MKKLILFLTATLLIFFSCKNLRDPIVVAPPEVPVDYNQPPKEMKEGNATFHYWKHSPLHVGNNLAVEFQLNASDKYGIKKIELYVFEHELFNDITGLPSKQKRDNGTWGLVKTWNLESPKMDFKVVYSLAEGFPANSNVEYIFKVYNSRDEVSERFAMFDAGVSPWEKDKILLYSASRKPLSKTINVCFFADVDFKQNWTKFLNETETLIYDGYHANNVITDRKELWNFYYTRQEADGYEILVNSGNEAAYPDFMKNSSITGIDAFGLLHSDVYNDATYFRSTFNFLSSNVFTSEVFNLGTAVHETAHAVFRLSDEYNGCACFQSERGANMFLTQEECMAFNQKNNFKNPECNIIEGYNGQQWFSPERNVLFSTEEQCYEFNNANGFPEKSCEIFINEKGRWFRSTSGVCIMQDDGDKNPNDFQRACSSLIDDYYEILSGNEVVDITMPSTILVNNIFGYEPVIALELIQNGSANVNLKIKNIQMGIPTKNILQSGAMNLDLKNKSGDMMHSVYLNNPNEVVYHGTDGKNSKEIMPHGSCVVMIPFDKNIAHASLNFQLSADSNIAVRGMTQDLNYEFDLSEKLGEMYLDFLRR